MGFFMLVIRKTNMTSLRCPYCYSEQVSKLDNQTDVFKSFEKLIESISPANLAALGMKLAKHAGIPPVLGGLIGVVVGGTLVMVSQHYFYKYYRNADQYHCHHCQRSFAVA